MDKAAEKFRKHIEKFAENSYFDYDSNCSFRENLASHYENIANRYNKMNIELLAQSIVARLEDDEIEEITTKVCYDIFNKQYIENLTHTIVLRSGKGIKLGNYITLKEETKNE